MRLSSLLGTRFKERPAEAVLESHALLLRGGYLRQQADGACALLPPGLRVLRRIERLVRTELDGLGGQEILPPETDGPDTGTHVLSLCRNELRSHAQLPCMLYQVRAARANGGEAGGGFLRARGFPALETWAFHRTAEDAAVFHARLLGSFGRVLLRAGLPAVLTAEAGPAGGCTAHAFVAPVKAGPDTVVVCPETGYAATADAARSRVPAHPAEPQPLEKVHTPDRKTIEEVAGFLGVPHHQAAKAVFFECDAEDRLVLAVIRGDREVNEAKLAGIIGGTPVPATDARIRAAGSVPGYASPMGLDPARVRLVVDHTVAQSANLVAGANEADYHCAGFNLNRDLPGIGTVDIDTARAGDLAPDGEGRLEFRRGIEIGRAALAGTGPAESAGLACLDSAGTPRAPFVGRAGLFTGRLMAAVVEARHDQFGPRWPASIAPWPAHLCALRLGDPGVKEAADRLYSALHTAGVETAYDDRDARAGVQFADADLLGAPFRLTVSARNLDAGIVEWKRRDTDESGTLPLDEAVETVAAWTAAARAALGPE
jgi:prolyl-tRNA synthetase